MEPRPLASASAGVVAVVLAAGYGTRLEAELRADGTPESLALVGVPKPLLHVRPGAPLLDDWVLAFLDCRARGGDKVRIDDVVVVVNDLHYNQFATWARRWGIPEDHIVNDGSRSNETRPGAIACLEIALERHRSVIEGHDVLVVAGDTLLYDSFHLPTFLEERRTDGDHILYYAVQDAEVSKRGIVEVDPATGRVTAFLEKPSPTETASRLACPAIYLLRNGSLPLVHEYLNQPDVRASRDAADAPGRLIQWLHTRTPVYGTPIEGRHDLGNLADYRRARWTGGVIEHAHARIGLVGNPSDGFNGKTLAVSVQDFYATVRIQPAASVHLVPHPVHDTGTFTSMDELAARTRVMGYYGGVRLLRATCKKFVERVRATCNVALTAGCRISYDSNIPFAVGLAGSSAIVTATFRALMRFYGVTLEMLRLPRDQAPSLILAIEREELGIVAGLQDRVIQEYDGLVFMDFARTILEQNHGAGAYTPLDVSLLPPLYLAYMVKAGGDSGKIHSDARRRWEQGDAIVVDGMRTMGAMTDQARTCLEAADFETLGRIMDANFDLRRSIYGDAVTGADNLRFVELARSLGFSAKFTGSGGAFVLLWRGRNGETASFVPTPHEQANVRARFRELGFAFVRVHPRRRGAPLTWTPPQS